MKARKDRNCDLCKKKIGEGISCYKIKKKFFYETSEGLFWNFGNVIICADCIDEIRNRLVEK